MSKRSSPPVTPTMIRQIRRMLRQGNLTQHEIAAHFRINQGRVSEVNTGKLK